MEHAHACWGLDLEDWLVHLLKKLFQILAQANGQSFDPLLYLVIANEPHQVSSVQQPNEIGIISLTNHLKSGGVQWKRLLFQIGWRSHLASVTDVFGREVRNTFSLHVENPSLLRAQKPLVAPSTVAVAAHIFQAVIESAPRLSSINVHMNVLVLLVDFFTQQFGWEACATQVGDLKKAAKSLMQCLLSKM